MTYEEFFCKDPATIFGHNVRMHNYFAGIVKVEYEGIPTISPIDSELSDIHLRKVFGHKTKDWITQDEVRIYAKCDEIHGRFLRFEKSCLKGIILGEKMGLQQQFTLRSIFKAFNYPKLTFLNVTRTELDSYEMRFTPAMHLD